MTSAIEMRTLVRRWARAGLLALLLPGLGGCVTVAEFRKLEYEVNRLKSQEGPVGDRARVADLSVEMDGLRSQLSQLEGRVEVGEHDARRALEEAQAARRDASALPPAGPAAYAPGGAAPYAPPGGADYPPGTAPTDPNGPGGAPGAGAPPPQAGAPAGGGKAAREELQAYRSGYDAWRTDDATVCVDRFRAFLQTYPSSAYSDDAAYWMADCYFKQGDYQTAILRFDDVASRYPTSDKAAEALYRQGEALLRLGPSFGQAAEKAFERVINEYPDSKLAQDAERRLRSLSAG
ncbi:MAG: tol-pal system protein YbgF [Deltaproteobacteria bacterium]|nr:tol-pal system protein YbgF [Deltaproteobacteria bacterium]